MPDTLIDLIDEYAETRHRYGRIHNAKTEAARKAVVEALSGVLSACTQPAIKPLEWSAESGPTDKIRYNHITAETALGQFSVEWKGWKEEDGPCVYLNGDYIGVASNLGGAKQLAERHIRELVANLLAASPTPPALSAAPAIGDELRDTLVAVSAAIAERDDRAAQKMICEILAASTTPPAEQQASPKAAPVTQTAPAPGERCQHCIDRHDGVYGSWAAPCPYHDDDGKPRPTANAAPQPAPAAQGDAASLSASAVGEPGASRAFLERALSAMEGVIDVADRNTTEFDALRSCVVDLTLMLFKPQACHPSPPDGIAGRLQAYRCKIKSRKQIGKEIPREQQGWWADVAAGQKLLLRQAMQSDIDRCTLGGKRSRNPDDYMCETQTHGALVPKIALEYMNPEENVFAAVPLPPTSAEGVEHG